MGIVDRLATFREKALCLGVVAVILITVSLVTRPLERSLWNDLYRDVPGLKLEEMDQALGQGVILGVFGGLRSLVADFAWLQLNQKWEARDLVSLRVFVRLVTSLDPKPEFFWINSARMLAYDVPHWRIAKAGGISVLESAAQKQIVVEQVNEAVALLERALVYHPRSANLKLEIGQVYLNRLKDFERAAPWFEAAIVEPNAPYYAARIYADILRALGQHQEAYLFLQQVHRELRDDPQAQAGVVLERIRELENFLEMPEVMRFREGQ
jgi:tetratricopeptide (TPR) repeat protein